ncbi:MAG: hypothetical protein EU539_00825 [Promethearchaeota archaeon]|nr:MAG: hypothetical protein EU539_00825 [Candidatus Lokiarchaeota archaeon]
MIYSLFLYQSKSGLLLFDKNFHDVSDGKLDMFASFFAALKSFISEMVLSGSKELKNIELGDYFVFISYIPEVNSDLVIIADKGDNKQISKLIPKIIRVILDHQELFIDWDHKAKSFKILDQPISDIILSKKKLVEGTSIFAQQESILKSIWSHKKDLTEEIKNNLIQEREILENKLSENQNLQTQLNIIEKLIEISEKLKDEKKFIKYQNDANRIKEDIEDRKIKLDYYLKRVKECLSGIVVNLGRKSLKEGDYKDAYLNLYSFSSKLKDLTDSGIYNKYLDYAKKLIDKEEITFEDFSAMITELLSMRDDIDFYLK